MGYASFSGATAAGRFGDDVCVRGAARRCCAQRLLRLRWAWCSDAGRAAPIARARRLRRWWAWGSPAMVPVCSAPPASCSASRRRKGSQAVASVYYFGMMAGRPDRLIASAFAGSRAAGGRLRRWLSQFGAAGRSVGAAGLISSTRRSRAGGNQTPAFRAARVRAVPIRSTAAAEGVTGVKAASPRPPRQREPELPPPASRSRRRRPTPRQASPPDWRATAPAPAPAADEGAESP